MQDAEQKVDRPQRQYTPEQQAQYQAALRMADALGEKEAGPRTQVVRVVRVLGLERAQALYEQTLATEAAGGLMLPDGSRRRTLGGVFFKLVRDTTTTQERGKIFPMRRQQGQKASQPQPAPQPAPLSTPTIPVIIDIPNATGEARVKITLVGRPGRIVQKQGYILTGMTAKSVPSLPKGMPTPPAKPTTYTVYIATKQWQKVAESLQNPDDVLVVEGTPVFDPQLEGIAVYVTNTTTKLLQQAQRTKQTES